MISQEEIEILSRRTFRASFSRIWQINKATIRIELKERVFIDIFQSLRDKTKFAFHAKVGTKIFRLDCRPERKYRRLKTFPWHLHKEVEEKVVSSPFSAEKGIALPQFFNFIKKVIKEENEN